MKGDSPYLLGPGILAATIGRKTTRNGDCHRNNIQVVVVEQGLWNQNPFDKIELQGKIPHQRLAPSRRAETQGWFFEPEWSISEITEVVYGENKVAFISDLMLAAVALIWGLGFPVTQMAIDAQLSSGLIVALRFLIAAAWLWGSSSGGKCCTITPRDALLGCVAGLILGMAFLLQVMGQSMTTPSNRPSSHRSMSLLCRF